MATRIVLRDPSRVVQVRSRARQQDALRLLSVKDTAQYAGVSATTVRRWIKAGELKIYRAGRQIRINENDLIEFLSDETLKWL